MILPPEFGQNNKAVRSSLHGLVRCDISSQTNKKAVGSNAHGLENLLILSTEQQAHSD
jgi:hypothetical protein